MLVYPRFESKDAYFSSNPLVRWIFYERLRKIYANIVENSSNNGKVLDAGCGSGIFLPILSKLFQEVYALDLPDRIDSLEPTISKMLNESNCSNVILVRGDILKLSEFFSKDSLDCIVCTDVLEHLKSPTKALRQFNECLKPEGIFEFSVPTETKFYNLLRTITRIPRPSHRENYSFRQILSIIEGVFSIKRLQAMPPIMTLFICGSAFPK